MEKTQYLNFCSMLHVVEGENGSVVYDLASNSIFDLKNKQSEIFNAMTRGSSYEDLIVDFEKEEVDKLWKQILDEKIAKESGKFYPKEPYRIGGLHYTDKVINYALLTCFLELPISCDRNCNSCQEKKVMGCYACSSSGRDEKIDLNKYHQLIDTIKKYNCRNIILYGGNIKRRWVEISKLIARIREGNRTEVFLVIEEHEDPEWVRYVNELGIYVILNIHFVKKRCSLPDVSNRLVVLNFIVEYEVFEEFKAFEKEELGDVSHKYCVYSSKQTDMQFDYILDFPICDTQNLGNRYQDDYHPCLYGKISIRANGDVYICKEEKGLAYGNINDCSLEEIMRRPDIRAAWKVSTNITESCGLCKYRKSCMNCSKYDQSYNKSTCARCTEIQRDKEGII